MKKCRLVYEFTKTKVERNNLFYINVLKLYTKGERNLDSLRIFNEDIGVYSANHEETSEENL